MISALRITHLPGWENNLLAYQNNHFDTKGGGAFEDAAKSSNSRKRTLVSSCV